MKNSSKILILAIFLVLICCVSAASAAENDNVTASGDELAVDEVAADDVIDEQDTLASQEVNVDEKLAEDSPSEYVVWVGTNSTPDGQGTEEDPFANLNLACNNYNAGEQKDKVTVNINEGTYYLDSFLKFNTNNLNIVGNGQVIIKNSDSVSHQSFGSDCNFTMANIIFNASDFNSLMDTYFTSGTIAWFTPFVGSNGNVIFDNCTFTDYNHVDPNTDMNYVLPPIDESFQGLYKNDYIELNQCKFINSHGFCFLNMMYDPYPLDLRFNYCSFSVDYGMERFGSYDNANLIFDSCWLGHNSIDSPMFYDMGIPSSNPGHYDLFSVEKMTISRYAVLTISENYLGNNEYELIGKLIWNDSTDDNIDKLGSMIVYLSADNGNIPSQVTLENGSFNVTYTAESEFHEIVARLDNQKINLNNKISFALDAPIINYGDNQNINVTFLDNVKGTVCVTIGNNDYKKYCDNLNSVIVPIDDILAKGSYDVDVSFVSDKNVVLKNNYYDEFYSFGFNSTTISVLGIDSSLTASPVTATYNVAKDLVATLTDANGNVLANKPVNIVVGNINKTLNTTPEGKVSVDVSGLVPDSYVATISFDGDEIYEGFSTTTDVVVNKVVPNVNISREGDLVPGKKLIIKVEIPYATENVTIIVNGDKNTTKLVDNAATYTIDELSQGTYYVTVLYVGDELCDFAYATDSFDVVKSTADLINELNNTIESQASEIGNLIATVVAQNTTIVAQQEQINNLKKTSGKDVVSKKATKITAPKKTFKAKTKTKKIKIKLTTGKTALKNKKVTLKVKGKTYTATTNKKGIATFKITKLTKKGTIKYTVKFAGDKAYKAVSKNGKIKIK